MVTKRNPAAARRLILDAAARAFAAHGPAGARIDAIAAEAGVNKRMLYHYFGDKEALFAAVLDDRLGGRAGLSPMAVLTPDGMSLDALDLRLMVWAETAGVAPGRDSTQSWHRLVEGLIGEQNAGRVRGDVEARLLALLLFATSAVAQLLPTQTRMLTGTARVSQAELEKLLRPAEADREGVPRPRQHGAPPRERVGRPRVRMLPEVRGG